MQTQCCSFLLECPHTPTTSCVRWYCHSGLATCSLPCMIVRHPLHDMYPLCSPCAQTQLSPTPLILRHTMSLTSAYSDERLNQLYGREQRRTFRTAWCAAPNAHRYIECILYLHLCYPRKLSTITAFPLSSHQHIIKWLPTPFYTYGTVRVHLRPPPLPICSSFLAFGSAAWSVWTVFTYLSMAPVQHGRPGELLAMHKMASHQSAITIAHK